MVYAIIGGTGLADFAHGLADDANKPAKDTAEEINVRTPYGEVFLYKCAFDGEEYFFLPRHGKHGQMPPHLINYRANIFALKELKADGVVAFCCVGGITQPPGTLMMCRQFIDRTQGRETSFSVPGKVLYTDVTEPYCPRLTEAVLNIASAKGISLLDGGVYVCTQGPRYETAAEIRVYAGWGAHLVGMTAVPEVPLAREAGLCYAAIGIVANYAAGIAGKVAHQGIDRIMSEAKPQLFSLITALGSALPGSCDCDAHIKK